MGLPALSAVEPLSPSSGSEGLLATLLLTFPLGNIECQFLPPKFPLKNAEDSGGNLTGSPEYPPGRTGSMMIRCNWLAPPRSISYLFPFFGG